LLAKYIYFLHYKVAYGATWWKSEARAETPSIEFYPDEQQDSDDDLAAPAVPVPTSLPAPSTTGGSSSSSITGGTNPANRPLLAPASTASRDLAAPTHTGGTCSSSSSAVAASGNTAGQALAAPSTNVTSASLKRAGDAQAPDSDEDKPLKPRKRNKAIQIASDDDDTEEKRTNKKPAAKPQPLSRRVPKVSTSSLAGKAGTQSDKSKQSVGTSKPSATAPLYSRSSANAAMAVEVAKKQAQAAAQTKEKNRLIAEANKLEEDETRKKAQEKQKQKKTNADTLTPRSQPTRGAKDAARRVISIFFSLT
jgi:hypothetical protein